MSKYACLRYGCITTRAHVALHDLTALWRRGGRTMVRGYQNGNSSRYTKTANEDGAEILGSGPFSSRMERKMRSIYPQYHPTLRHT